MMVSVVQSAEIWKIYFDRPLNVRAVVVSAFIFLKFCLFCLQGKNILLNFPALTPKTSLFRNLQLIPYRNLYERNTKENWK